MLTVEEYRQFIYPLLDSARADRDAQANIRRGLSALDKVLKTSATVHRAMHREGLGWVDFVWGDEGEAPDVRGRRPGGKGVAHVLEARPRKDKLTSPQTLALLRKMVHVIARGKESPSKPVGNIRQIVLIHDGIEVRLVKRAGSNAWILTAFEQW